MRAGGDRLRRPNSLLGSGKQMCHAVKQGEKVTCLLPTDRIKPTAGRFQRDKGFCRPCFAQVSLSHAYQLLVPGDAPPPPGSRSSPRLRPPPLFSEARSSTAPLSQRPPSHRHCPNARPLARDSTRQPGKHLADRGHGSLPTPLLLHKYALNIQLEFIHREQQLRR